MEINRDIIKNIINKNFDVVESTKKKFPTIVAVPSFSWAVINEKRYFLLSFFGLAEKKRIEEMTQKKYHPYPGLIAKVDTDKPVGFRIDNARYCYIDHCSVKNRMGFALGLDSTVILSDYRQTIVLPELGEYHFNIDLAYMISFGTVILPSNLYECLEDLMAYSVNQWRAK